MADYHQTLAPVAFRSSHPAVLGAFSGCNTSSLRLFSSMPNLRSLDLRHVPAPHLGSILHLVGGANLERLSLSLEATAWAECVAGLPHLKALHILWGECTSNGLAFVSDPTFPEFMWDLIEPSITTLEHLHVAVADPRKQKRTLFNFAPINFPMLRTLYFDSCTGNVDMVSLLPEMAPNIEDLTLNLETWDRPDHRDTFVRSFSKLKRLKRLSLIIDADAEISPSLPASLGIIWPPSDRKDILHPRWRERYYGPHHSSSKHLIKQCFSLEYIGWLRFRDKIGDVEALTQFLIVHTAPWSQGPLLKLGWDSWEVECYKRALPGKPLPALVLELDAIEYTKPSWATGRQFDMK
ncbi:hypothetical protein FPV67DRAFT_1451049 [Lyophyllum atratum]|nr:hypothetical protein FPV67DRAFT_1451049 [Lyophyllum atratum]